MSEYVKFKMCGECMEVIINNYRQVGECKCAHGREYYGSAPNIMAHKPSFNLGLGCVTNNSRHAEKIAKSRGLQPIGDAPLPDAKTERKKEFRKELKQTMTEGIKAARAGKTLEGKPLKKGKK